MSPESVESIKLKKINDFEFIEVQNASDTRSEYEKTWSLGYHDVTTELSNITFEHRLSISDSGDNFINSNKLESLSAYKVIKNYKHKDREYLSIRADMEHLNAYIYGEHLASGFSEEHYKRDEDSIKLDDNPCNNARVLLYAINDDKDLECDCYYDFPSTNTTIEKYGAGTMIPDWYTKNGMGDAQFRIPYVKALSVIKKLQEAKDAKIEINFELLSFEQHQSTLDKMQNLFVPEASFDNDDLPSSCIINGISVLSVNKNNVKEWLTKEDRRYISEEKAEKIKDEIRKADRNIAKEESMFAYRGRVLFRLEIIIILAVIIAILIFYKF